MTTNRTPARRGRQAGRRRGQESIEALSEALRLVPHPEGGAYAQHYPLIPGPPIPGAPTPGRGSPAGAACSAIYYLLSAGARSAWHRLTKDELWHHYQGAPVELHLICEPRGAGRAGASYRVLRLGPVDKTGTRPCQLVPAGAWQAARPVRVRRGPTYALVGNTVAPGFSFEDWELADAATLKRLARAVPAARAALRAFSGRKERI
jgi:predicted cupin superfamily sugar epimerase